MTSQPGGYYLPSPSHWPVVGSVALFLMALGGVLIALVVQLAGEPAEAIAQNFSGEPMDWRAWQGGVQYALVNSISHGVVVDLLGKR